MSGIVRPKILGVMITRKIWEKYSFKAPALALGE